MAQTTAKNWVPRLYVARELRGWRRQERSYVALLDTLEDRRLLSSTAAPDVASEAAPLAFDSPLGATIGPLGTSYYQLSSVVAGKLTVVLDAPAFPARISLVDANGNALVQSDGSAAGAGDYLINADVPAGTDFLKLQSLGGRGSYQLQAHFTAIVPAFQKVSSLFYQASELAEGDLNGDGITDLVAPDGIHLGVGDGTFQSAVVDGPLGDPDWTVTAITVADFNSDQRPDIAYTETSPDGTCGKLCVLQNEGGGQFQPVEAFDICPDPVAVQAIDFGNGTVELAVADGAADTVAIFSDNGDGIFARGSILDIGYQPTAMVSGRFGDGHLDLVVAELGDPDTGDGQGLVVFQDDGIGNFQRYRTIAVGSGPAAVVAGAFTGNGLLDLAVANNDSDDVSILLNDGHGGFQAPVSYTVGNTPVALVAQDFGNGHLDLATANENSDDVSVLLGNGDGTFQSQLRFGAGDFPGELVTADFNGDDRYDLAVGDLGSGADVGDITILLGRGDGTFQDQVENTVGNGPQDAVAADLNHDGHADLVLADVYSNDVSVLLGNGDGTFQIAKYFPAGAGPTSVAVGDFNGDGRLDLAVTDSGGSNRKGQGVSILLGNGDGTFQKPVPYSTGLFPSSIVAGCFMGDGVVDLAVANQGSNSVTILLGDGHGNFRALPPIALGARVSGPVSITAGDFGNGAIDLAVANQGSNNISVLMNEGGGAFQVLPPISLGTGPSNLPSAIVAGDFTGSGAFDLAVVSTNTRTNDNVTILLGQGQGRFAVVAPVPLGKGLGPTSIIAAQLFGAGPLDLAIADSRANAISLLMGDGQGGFKVLPALRLDSGGAPVALAADDFTGTGLLDLAVARYGPNGVTIELNGGNGQFAQADSVGLAARNTPLVADFSGDGVSDLAIVDGSGNILFRAGVPGQPGSFVPPIAINTGDPSRGITADPSRDIAAITTSQGTLLASVDATDNAVSLFAYRSGQFTRIGALPTGALPAQIVSADLEGNGRDDLVIRNAGDGSLTIYLSNGHAGFLAPINVPVGSGIADVSVADVNQDRLLDILLANQTAGEVEVMLNHGAAGFGPPTLYRAGTGLSAVIAGADATPLSLQSLEGTVAVAVAPASGGPPDIVALNAGSETIGVLDGLGGGRFANPNSLPTTGPTLAVTVADFSDDGNADLAVLGTDGLTVWLGNGKGGFVPSATYDVGPDPTGLSIADVNGDGNPDLVVGNAFGDVRVLLGRGNGTFSQPVIADQNVLLAVAHNPANGAPIFVFANQSSDRVVVQYGPQGQPTVVTNRTNGLMVPGTPVLADLNGNGIMDLVVPNSGGNSVLVYPALAGGGFGPAMNNGNGFSVGTNPVFVLVADVNGDGRPDLIVANEGSNNVSVLLNEPQGNSFTFMRGPTLSAGVGPVGLAYGNFTNDATPDIAVSDGGSKDVMVLPGLGNGFFDDLNPLAVPLANSPGPIFAGPFIPGTGTDIVALNPGGATVALIAGLSTGTPTTRSFSSGGLDPVAAVTVAGVNGIEDLVVANNGDGRVALLVGGPEGLTVEEFSQLLNAPGPTGLALASFQNDTLAVYATAEGQEAASLLVFSLSGIGSPSASVGGGLTLLPLQEESLPLIATLLAPYIDLNQSEAEPVGPQGLTATTPTTASLGQGPLGQSVEQEDEEDDGGVASQGDVVPLSFAVGAGRPAWTRIVIGLDEAFEEFRRETQKNPATDDGPEKDEESQPPDADPPQGPFEAVSQARKTDRAEIVDHALESFVQSNLATAVAPALRDDRYRGITEVRSQPRALNRTVLCLLSGTLLLTSVIAARRTRGQRVIPARFLMFPTRSGGPRS